MSYISDVRINEMILSTGNQVKLLQNQLYRLRKKNLTLSCNLVKTPAQLISKMEKYLGGTLLDLVKGQIMNAVKSKTGVRYGVQERRFALATFHHSPKAYRFLRSIFRLPSVSTLHSWLREIPLHTGWSKSTLTVLKNKAEALPKEEILCGIVFDAMSLKESLHFDKATDTVIGREDFGEHGKSLKLANHALVFMVKGLIKNWKMVLGYFFYSGGITTSRLQELFEASISKVQETGMKVMFTVCDQEGAHRSLFQTLGMSPEKPYFELNGERIHFFYDAPHLLKSLRNTLLKYNIKIGGNVISWDHIKNFFTKDHEQKIRLAPKLSKRHMCEEGFSKMRVNLAAQVMSGTVAAGIYMHSVAGLLPQEAEHTAEFVQKVDKLFDCFNSIRPCHYKKLLRGVSSKSCHMGFIREITDYIKSFEICTPPRVQIYCIDGWLINLAALQALWSDLQEYEVKFLLTRRLNQDCLENLFGKLRLRGGSNDHPTVYCFSKALRSVVNNDLLQVPLSGNCERDESLLLDVTSDCETDCPAPPLELESDSEDIFEDNLPVAEVNGLMYVVGWTCKKFLKFHDCSICREHLLDTKQDSDNINKLFCHLKAENNSESPFGGLTIPSATCLQHFKEVEYIVRNSIERAMLSTNVSKNLLSRLSNHTFITPLQLCSTQLVSTIYLIYIRLKIFSNLKWKNKEKVRKSSKKNRKVIKVMH